jgi:hypothetical protein
MHSVIRQAKPPSTRPGVVTAQRAGLAPPILLLQLPPQPRPRRAITTSDARDRGGGLVVDGDAARGW